MHYGYHFRSWNCFRVSNFCLKIPNIYHFGYIKSAARSTSGCVATAPKIGTATLCVHHTTRNHPDEYVAILWPIGDRAGHIRNKNNRIVIREEQVKCDVNNVKLDLKSWNLTYQGLKHDVSGWNTMSKLCTRSLKSKPYRNIFNRLSNIPGTCMVAQEMWGWIDLGTYISSEYITVVYEFSQWT